MSTCSFVQIFTLVMRKDPSLRFRDCGFKHGLDAQTCSFEGPQYFRQRTEERLDLYMLIACPECTLPIERPRRLGMKVGDEDACARTTHASEFRCKRPKIDDMRENERADDDVSRFNC